VQLNGNCLKSRCDPFRFFRRFDRMDKEADKGFVAAYLKLSRKSLKEKIHHAEEALKNCSLCPRNCGVDRTAGETGFCGTGIRPFVSSWNPHFGEEAPLVGRNGSGTIFFTHCNLGCLFCQNWTISHGDEGNEITVEALSSLMLTLQQDYGCHNINFVTPVFVNAAPKFKTARIFQ